MPKMNTYPAAASIDDTDVFVKEEADGTRTEKVTAVQLANYAKSKGANVDATLTQAGVPADAKAAGDAVTDLKSAVKTVAALLPGAGETYASAEYDVITPGHTYRVHVNNWDTEGMTLSAGYTKFLLGYVVAGTQTTLHDIRFGTDLLPYYDITIPRDIASPKLLVGGRANSGTNGILYIEDITASATVLPLNNDVHNLIGDGYMHLPINYRTQTGGFTLSNNGDGSWTVSGTSTADVNSAVGQYDLELNKKYKFELNQSIPESSNCYLYIRKNEAAGQWVRSGQEFELLSDTRINLMIFASSSGIALNATITPILTTEDYATIPEIIEKINDLNTDVNLTEYQRSGIARIKTEIESKYPLGNLLIFGFNTDQHIYTENQKKAVKRGLEVMSHLTRFVPYDFICLGGDAAHEGGYSNNLDVLLSECAEVQAPIYNAWCPVVPITGNHEASQNNTNMRGPMLFNVDFKRICNSGFLGNWDSSHTNGTWDSEAHKIRVIFLDDTSRTDYPKYDPAGQVGVSVYSKFMAMLTSTPADYSIIIISHHPISDQLGGNFANPLSFQSYLVPYKDRIICCLCGHTHWDGAATSDGILYISTTCAKYGTDIEGHDRTIDTEQETAEDTFVIDQATKMIYTYRYGYGSNRVFNYDNTSSGFGQVT